MAEPIKILGIVEGEVGKPRNDGPHGSALYAVPFRLSQPVSAAWARLFEHTWDHPPEFTGRHRPGICRVAGDRIILDGTTVEEVEQVHRGTLLAVLKHVNAGMSHVESEHDRQQQDRERRDQEHAQTVKDAAKRIKFE